MRCNRYYGNSSSFSKYPYHSSLHSFAPRHPSGSPYALSSTSLNFGCSTFTEDSYYQETVSSTYFTSVEKSLRELKGSHAWNLCYCTSSNTNCRDVFYILSLASFCSSLLAHPQDLRFSLSGKQSCCGSTEQPKLHLHLSKRFLIPLQLFFFSYPFPLLRIYPVLLPRASVISAGKDSIIIREGSISLLWCFH